VWVGGCPNKPNPAELILGVLTVPLNPEKCSHHSTLRFANKGNMICAVFCQHAKLIPQGKLNRAM
jgi:hypothetical protein